MLARLGAAFAVVVLALSVSAPAVAAGDDDGLVSVTPVDDGAPALGNPGAIVDVGAEDPGDGTKARPAADRTHRTDGESRCTFLGEAVPCTNPHHGTWYAPSSCWIRRLSPQPPKTEPMWDGHTDGTIYWCEQPEMPGQTLGHYLWIPDGEAGVAAAVDPAVLAERAVERMNLVGAKVGATPLNGGDGVVGLQTWLWVANDGPASMGPISRTATAGSVSVTATARVTQVDWDLGNGERKRCTGAGTKWTRGYGAKDSPTCGYTYLRDSGDQPADAYRITATTHWRVDWEGGGQTGTITFTLEGAPLSMTVVELQAPRIL